MIGLIEPNTADRISELQRTVSASRLNLWLTCRLKFYFRYVLKLTKPKTAALHFGSVVHLVLQQWSLSRWRKQPFEITRLKAVFDTGWSDQTSPIDWDGEEAEQRQLAWAVLERYFTDTPIRANEIPEAVEVSVEADLTQHGLPILIGVLDLVRAGGRIVDFKSAAKSPSPELALHQNGLQLDCYSVLYREATGKREGGRELHHLVKTKSPKIIITTTAPMTDPQQDRLFRLLESYLTGLERRDFVPSVGMQCTGCEFLRECGQWRGKELHA